MECLDFTTSLHAQAQPLEQLLPPQAVGGRGPLDLLDAKLPWHAPRVELVWPAAAQLPPHEAGAYSENR